MDKYTGLLVVEVGLPTSLNLCCFLCLMHRCVKILNAGLLYNTKIPRRLRAKQVLLGLWLLHSLFELVILNVRQSSKNNYDYFWIQ